MQQVVSKAQFKAQALEYLRSIEEKKQPLIITHAGKPVVQIIPYPEKGLLEKLKNTVLFYKDPTVPVENHWEALK